MKNFIERAAMKWIGNDRFLSMQIDITNFCNLSCAHCYHPNHSNNGNLSLNQWINILKQYEALLNKMNLRGHIIICGGEPFASPYLFPLINEIKNSNLKHHVTILTNGTLIDHIDFSKFEGLEKLDFQVSLDGPNQELHDSFRGRGNFNKAIKGIRRIKEFGYPIYLQATLTRKNSHYIKEFFSLAKSMNIVAMNFTRLVEVGYGQQLTQSKNDNALTPLELKKTFENIIIQSSLSGVKTDTEIPLMNLIHPFLGKKYSFGESIVIDFQGNLLASSRSRFKIGKVSDNNLEVLFFKNNIKKDFFKKEKFECFSCSHFDFCGGDLNASYAKHGDFFKKDPGCWINIESA